MIDPFKSESFAPPVNYQDWVNLFSKVKNEKNCDPEIFSALSRGSFPSMTERIEAPFKEQLCETVNIVLDRGVKRFIKELNESISFNDLSQVDILFIRLKKDVRRARFFESLHFLGEDFIKELTDSLKAQMSGFWNDTVSFLYEQSVEFSNSELEDALYTVKRMKLFD